MSAVLTFDALQICERGASHSEAIALSTAGI